MYIYFNSVINKIFLQFEKDDDVLSTMSAICGEHASDIWRKLVKSDRTDYKTATYLLLLDRKFRGLSLRISSSAKSHFKSEVIHFFRR